MWILPVIGAPVSLNGPVHVGGIKVIAGDFGLNDFSDLTLHFDRHSLVSGSNCEVISMEQSSKPVRALVRYIVVVVVSGKNLDWVFVCTTTYDGAATEKV